MPFKIKGDTQVEGNLLLPNETSQRALITNASGEIDTSATTSAELAFVSGVTSSVQTQLDAKIPLTQKAANNGVATLDAGGKIPVAQLPSSVMTYEGTWNANTNTPTLTNGTGDAGQVYLVSVAGTTNFGAGPITFDLGDWAVYSGTIWQKSINSNAVVSVNGQTGVVSLSTTNIAEGTNLYYTDARARASVSVTDTASIDLTYNSSTGNLSGAVLPAGVNHDALQNYVANQHIDHTAVQIATTSATSGLTGGGTIAATRNLSVDILGTTAMTVPLNADSLLVYDSAGTALKRITRGNFLSGIPTASNGDINETSFTMANNQVSAANVTGLAFANATVRSFNALVSIQRDATSDLFEVFTLRGIQKGAAWDMSVTANGDDSGIVFSITTTGQIQYISSNLAGHVSSIAKFKAITTTV